MRICFISNYFSPHQAPLSEALFRLTDGRYRFVVTGSMPKEREAFGYHLQAVPDYVLRYDADRRQVDEIIASADVVVFGACPDKLVRRRIKAGKLTFRYSERPLKKGNVWWKIVPRWFKWRINNPGSDQLYLLSAGGFSSDDYNRFGLFVDRSFRWGYFPETRRYPDPETLFRAKSGAFLWCGRFLDWKHPDDAILAMRQLKQDGSRPRLDMIGTGPMESELKRMTAELELEDCVFFHGAMRTEQVRELMERAGTFLFTSDQIEGWGVVLNEAMNSGCAVIASHLAGSVPYLIKNGENGLVYHCGDVAELGSLCRVCLEAPERRLALGRAAYETIQSEWNAETAAQRLLLLSERLLEGARGESPFDTGPCSKAGRLKKDWVSL